MLTDTTFAMIDTTDPDTPIWNEVLAEFRDQLVAAGILYSPTMELVARADDVPEPEHGSDQEPEPAETADAEQAG